jgi:hypothetical protein
VDDGHHLHAILIDAGQRTATVPKTGYVVWVSYFEVVDYRIDVYFDALDNVFGVEHWAADLLLSLNESYEAAQQLGDCAEA